jgi:hypothetical protein
MVSDIFLNESGYNFHVYIRDGVLYNTVTAEIEETFMGTFDVVICDTTEDLYQLREFRNETDATMYALKQLKKLKEAVKAGQSMHWKGFWKTTKTTVS